MPQKKSFPLRVNGEILDAMKRWSADELRSVNAQIEWVLRDALRRSGRLPRPGRSPGDEGEE
ncbi:MAG: Arc family DNA binding domain-containing protein [Gammaproteobacteria bacterium]